MTDESETGFVNRVYLDLVLMLLRGILGLIFFAQGMTKFGWFGGTDPLGVDARVEWTTRYTPLR